MNSLNLGDMETQAITMRNVCCFFIVVCLCGCSYATDEVPRKAESGVDKEVPTKAEYKVKIDRKEDKAEINTEPDQTVVLVTSTRGIGSAKIVLARGEWPKEIVVRLRYSPGKPLRNLEGLTL